MAKKRFHYYAQQSTKVLVEPLEVKRWVEDGDLVKAAGVKFQVIATPGYTRESVSYLAVVDGKRCAFTGDLIYGDGKIFDLYSFQDAIPEAKVGWVSWVRGAVGGFGEQPPKNQSMEAGCDLSSARTCNS